MIDAAWRNGSTENFIFSALPASIPSFHRQPPILRKESLLTGPLEPTNEAYAIAKIAGLKLPQAYRTRYQLSLRSSLMPTNLYGPGDNFDLETSHVLPALIQRFHQAKISGSAEVVLWGTGTPRREFLHVDDLASAAYFAMEDYDSPEPLNIGTGEDLTIADLAGMVARIVEYSGAVVSIHRSPTARHESCLTFRDSPVWAGGLALIWRTVSRPPMPGISTALPLW